MRRVFCTVLAVLICVGCLSTLAEQPDTILFRDIPWMESEAKVTKLMESVMTESSWLDSVYENVRIDGWFRTGRYYMADPVVDNGGVRVFYAGIDVAGYTANLELSFAYLIRNKEVCRKTGESRFYAARYDISDLTDVQGAYNDLEEKLTQLYGTPKAQSEYNPIERVKDPKGMIWKAKDGSLVWLCMYYNSASKSYSEIHIVYTAPNTDSMLNELNKQIKAETAAEEAASREENIDSYNGL